MSLVILHFYIQSFQDWICWPRGSPVCASVCVCVCLSQPLISTILGRFWWNLDHMILTKIWDDTFLKFWKFCFDDVITAFFLLFCNAALSCLQLLFKFLQTWSSFSLTHAFVWDCNPAFWVQIFYPIWPPKITEKPLNTNFVKNEKQNDDYYWFGSADD